MKRMYRNIRLTARITTVKTPMVARNTTCLCWQQFCSSQFGFMLSDYNLKKWKRKEKNVKNCLNIQDPRINIQTAHFGEDQEPNWRRQIVRKFKNSRIKKKR